MQILPVAAVPTGRRPCSWLHAWRVPALPLLWLQPSPWRGQSAAVMASGCLRPPRFPVQPPPPPPRQTCLLSEGQITGSRKREEGFRANGQGLHIQVRVPSGALWCRTGPGVRGRGGEQALPTRPLSGTKLQEVLEF